MICAPRYIPQSFGRVSGLHRKSPSCAQSQRRARQGALNLQRRHPTSRAACLVSQPAQGLCCAWPLACAPPPPPPLPPPCSGQGCTTVRGRSEEMGATGAASACSSPAGAKLSVTVLPRPLQQAPRCWPACWSSRRHLTWGAGPTSRCSTSQSVQGEPWAQGLKAERTGGPLRCDRRSERARRRRYVPPWHRPSAPPQLPPPPGTLLERAASDFPQHEAMVSAHQGVRLTYSELLRQADEVARGLLALGVQVGVVLRCAVLRCLCFDVRARPVCSCTGPAGAGSAGGNSRRQCRSGSRGCRQWGWARGCVCVHPCFACGALVTGCLCSAAPMLPRRRWPRLFGPASTAPPPTCLPTCPASQRCPTRPCSATTEWGYGRPTAPSGRCCSTRPHG